MSKLFKFISLRKMKIIKTVSIGQLIVMTAVSAMTAVEAVFNYYAQSS